MRLSRVLVALIGAAAVSVAVAVPALAHPLGNFTINRFSQIQVDGGRINVLYVIDYAEIPAFQEKQRMADAPGYLDAKVAELIRGLRLEIGGRVVPLVRQGQSVTFLQGQAGLQTMRLQVLLSAVVPSGGRQSAVYRDQNYPGRLGWKEIVVQQAGEATVVHSSAPSGSVSNELRAYPQDRLASPLNVTAADFTFIRASSSGAGQGLRIEAPGTFGFVQDRFAALITPAHLSVSLLALSLLAALALGAVHGLSPGHGKAVMAGYLVGAHGTPRHAIELGLTITVTHTAGVFIIGLITLYAASVVTPERLYPWLTLLSGVLVVSLGSALLWSRARTAIHGHSHAHDHAHGGMQRGGLLALGVSGGIVPCPSALVVLLAAVSLHRILFGLLLIVAFSAGLATVLTGIGLALAGGLPLLRRVRRAGQHSIVTQSVRFLPVASALVVTIAGLGLTAQAIPGVR